MAKKRMMLYFGSFNPVHRGHTALAEYAIEQGLCDEVAMIISPQNPFKQDMTMAAEMDRYTMVEIACRNSRFPNHIKPSVIEFLLEKPSYTINTLRHLQENYGDMMEFTILMGSDLINTLPQWREADKIMEGFDIYVYPRPNVEMTFSTERTTFLADAPQHDYSSTEVREALQQGKNINKMVDGEVQDYIKEKKLWKAEQQ
jgi:nicotinate-nucleotide adenylyltransferase